MWGETAAAELGLTPEAWWKAVGTGPYFRFDGPGPAGWTLTELGRTELLDTPGEGP